MRGIVTGAVLALTVVLVGCTTNGTAETKTWKGQWDGNRQATSTLEFLDGMQLNYCFRSECTQTKYTGDQKGVVRFNWGQAKFTFQWTGNGYQGTRQAGNIVNRSVLK